MGNDSYRSYIRLAKGHEAKELKPYVNKMREDHFPLKEMKNMGIELNYDFTVLSDVYTQDPYVKKMGWIMGIIAFVLLFTSVMNYLLIIVGNLVGRSREMAVRINSLQEATASVREESNIVSLKNYYISSAKVLQKSEKTERFFKNILFVQFLQFFCQ